MSEKPDDRDDDDDEDDDEVVWPAPQPDPTREPDEPWARG